MEIRELMRKNAGATRLRPEDCLIFSMRSRDHAKVGKWGKQKN
jgi:hypothetical protein